MLYRILQILLWPLFKILFFFKVENRKKIPKDTKLIVCSNHINFLDPVLLAVSIGRPISFLAKKELFEHKFFGKFLKSLGAIPVDRFGYDLGAIKDSLRVLKNDQLLGIFPEGTRVKEVSRDNIKDGIGYMAYKGKSDILPLKIEGSYKLFRRTKVVMKDFIRIEDYQDMKKSDAYKKIANDVYDSIYDVK